MKILLLLLFLIFPALGFCDNSAFTPGGNVFWVSGNVGINTTSNVGIGSDSPGQQLDINANARVTGTNSLFFGNQNLASIKTDAPTTNSTLIFTTSNGGAGAIHEDARFDNIGNLGVGTFAPQALLHIGAGGDAPSDTNTAIYASNKGPTIIAARNSTNDVEGYLQAGALNVNLDAATASPLFIGGTATRIQMLSNVGISSATPGSKLDVQGTSRFLNGNVGIGTSSPGVVLDVVGTMRLNGTGAGSFRIQSAANQACTTTCTTGKAIVGFDQGTLGAVLPNIVGPSDATADECLCGS